MKFLRREKGLIEKQQAVNERLAAIKKQIETKEGAISNAKENLSKALGDMALEETELNKETVKRAKKLLERHADGMDDLKTMAAALEAEKENLAKELLEACIREAPDKAATAVAGYNDLLRQAVEALAVLRKYHAEMLKQQAEYNSILQERAHALQVLGKVEGLNNMETGLGELALVPTPHRHVMATPDAGFDRFLMTLLDYETKLRDYKAFTAANPKQGQTWDVDRSIGAFGDVGAPDRNKDFVQVYDPLEQR